MNVPERDESAAAEQGLDKGWKPKELTQVSAALALSESATADDRVNAANVLIQSRLPGQPFDPTGSTYFGGKNPDPVAFYDYARKVFEIGPESILTPEYKELMAAQDDEEKVLGIAKSKLGPFRRVVEKIGDATEDPFAPLTDTELQLADDETKAAHQILADQRRYRNEAQAAYSSRRIPTDVRPPTAEAGSPEFKAAAEKVAKHRQNVRDRGTIADYQSKVLADNVWYQYQLVKDKLDPDTDEIVRAAFASKTLTPRMADKFRNLKDGDQQRLAASLIYGAKLHGDKALLRDAGRQFAAMLIDVPKDAFESLFVDSVKRLVMDDAQYQKQAETAALLAEAEAPRMAEYGYWGDAVIGFAATIPYMGYAMIPKIGTGMIAAKAAKDFEERVAASGGDVTSGEFQAAKWSSAIAYAAVEKMQALRIAGPIDDMVMRQAYLKFWKKANIVLIARNTANNVVSETWQEGVQKAVEDGFVAYGLGQDVARNAAMGLVQELKDSFGTMAFVAGFGIPVQAVRSRATRNHTLSEIISGSLHVSALIDAHRNNDAEAIAKHRAALASLSRQIRDAGSTQNAIEQLKAQGVDEVDATYLTVFLENEARMIRKDAGLTEDQKEELIGKERTAVEVMQDLMPDAQVEANAGADGTPDGTFTIRRTVAGTETVTRVVPVENVEYDLSTPEAAASALKRLNENGYTITPEMWNAMSTVEKTVLVDDAGISRASAWRFESPYGQGVTDGQLKVLTGEIQIARGMEPSTIFHEYFHGMVKYLTETKTLAPADVAKLREEFGPPAEGVDEQFNEEDAADRFKDYAAKKVHFTKSSALEKVWEAAADLLSKAKELVLRTKPAQPTIDEAMFEQVISGEYTGIPVATVRKSKEKAQETPAPDATPAQDEPEAGTKPDAAPAEIPPANANVGPNPAKPPASPGGMNLDGLKAKDQQKVADKAASFDQEPGKWQAVTPKEGVKVSGSWAVTDLDALVTSDSPDFDRDLQPRDRGNIASRVQIHDIARRVNPLQLYDSAETDGGSPIVTAQMHVLSGNGRTLALREARDLGLLDDYEIFVRKKAAEMGIDIPASIRTPVLVRRVENTSDKAELQRIAELSNKPKILARNESEMAEADAKMLVDKGLLKLFQPGAAGNIMALSNAPFMVAFVRAAGADDLVNSDGHPTDLAERRVKRALLALLIGEGENARQIIRSLTENAAEMGMGTVVDGVLKAIGDIVGISQAKPSLSIVDATGMALRDYLEMKIANFADAKSWVGQVDMFNIRRRAVADLVLAFEARANTSIGIAAIFKDYAAKARLFDTSTQTLGLSQEDNIATLLEQAIADTASEAEADAKAQASPTPADADKATVPPPPPVAKRQEEAKADKQEDEERQPPPRTSLAIQPGQTPFAEIGKGQKAVPTKDAPETKWKLGIPLFMGAKRGLADRATAAIRRLLSKRQREAVKTVWDGFGGSGGWGLYHALENFTNADTVSIGEYDRNRMEKIKFFHSKGDKLGEVIDSPAFVSIRRDIVRAMVSRQDEAAAQPTLDLGVAQAQPGKQELTSAGTLANRAQEILDARVKAGELNIADVIAAVQAIIDTANNGRQQGADTASEMFDEIERTAIRDAAEIFKSAQAFRDRGGKIEYRPEQDTYGTAIPAGNSVFVLLDPPYYLTQDYDPDDPGKKVGIDTYRRTRDIVKRAVSQGNGILYTDSAWWLDNKANAEAGLTVPEDHQIVVDIYNELDHFDVADGKVGDRHEAIGVHHGRQGTETERRSRDGVAGPAVQQEADGRVYQPPGTGTPADQDVPGMAEGTPGEAGTVRGEDDRGPNATRLTFSRSDAEYMAAVERGDTATAQQIVDEAAKRAGYKTRVYHGTDQARNDLQGGTFVTDNAKAARSYAYMKAIERAAEDNEQFSEILSEIMGEEGAESIQDLSVSTLESIIEGNNIDIDLSASGETISLRMKASNVLDLTDEGTDVGDVASVWKRLHEDGLVDDSWESLDEEAVRELKDEYGNKTMYALLEREGVYAKAYSKGYDAVSFMDVSPDGDVHTTWIADKAMQYKSADPITRDDSGRIIPPSERFNPQSDDIRYSFDRTGPLSPELAAAVLKSRDGQGAMEEGELKAAIERNDPLLPYHVLHYWTTIGFTEIADDANPEITKAFEDALARIPPTSLPGMELYRYQGYQSAQARAAYLKGIKPGGYVEIQRPTNAFSRHASYGQEMADAYGGRFVVQFIVESPRQGRDVGVLMHNGRPGGEYLYRRGDRFRVASVEDGENGAKVVRLEESSRAGRKEAGRFSFDHQKLYADVLANAKTSDKLDGNKAWLTLDGKWINVDEHRDSVPFVGGIYENVGVQEMAEAGLVRVHWVSYFKQPGGVMYAEHAPGRLTRAQRKELEDTAIERGGEVEYDPGQAWIRQARFSFDKPVAPAFYSQLRRVIEQKVPNRATVAQIRATIDPAKGNGVKADEIFWSGLDEFLSSKKPTDMVTKEEVLAATREVVVTDVVKGAYRDSLYAELRRKYNIPENDTIADHAEELSPEDYAAWNVPEDSADHRAKFENYVLPGGENYRELLLTLPPRDYMSRLKAFADKRGISNIQEAERQYKLTEEGMYPDAQPGDFRSGHFSEPNIVAHVRFNERTSADGKRTLFIEEIQSDWAQKGKKEGFAGTEDEYTAYYDAKGQKVPIGYGKTEQEALANADPKWSTLVEVKVEKTTRPKPGQPPAPYVTKTDAWVSLALKRMVRWAAENGFEQVAWTTGIQQVSRYEESMRQVVDRIEWTKPLPSGNRGVVAIKNGTEVLNADVDKDGKVAAASHGDAIGKQLGEVVGKTLAERIMSETGKGSADGKDLTIGGEGMKGFYDQIVPTTANKLFKRFGAKVEETDIGSSGAQPDPIRLDSSIPRDPSNGGRNRDRIFDHFETKYVKGQNVKIVGVHADGKKVEVSTIGMGKTPAEIGSAKSVADGLVEDYNKTLKLWREQEKPVPVHALPITPAMRESVMTEGQARFSFARMRPEVSGNSAAIASLAVQKLAGKEIGTEQAARAMYLFKPEGATAEQLLAEANKMADGAIGHAAKRALESADPTKAMTIIAANAEMQAAVAARAGAVEGAATALRMGKTAARGEAAALKQLLIAAKGENLQQFEIDTGISWTETLLSFLPEKWKEWEDDAKKGDQAQGPQKPGNEPEPPKATEQELAEREKRMGQLIEAAQAWDAQRRAKLENERDDKKAEDAKEGAGGETEETDEAEEAAIPAIPKELLEAHGVDLTSPEAIANAIRLWIGDWIVRNSDGRLTPETVWKDPEAVEMYRKTIRQQLEDMAAKLLDPSDYGPVFVARMIGDLPRTGRPDTFERRTALILASIQAHAIRQSRRELVNGIRKTIDDMAKQGKKFDPMEEDLKRKVSAEPEKIARYVKQYIGWGADKCHAELEKLQAQIEARQKIYDEQHGSLDATADIQLHYDQIKLAMLARWGNLKSMLPAEIKAAGEEITAWLSSEQERLQRDWFRQAEANSGMMTAILEGVVPTDPEKAKQEPGAVQQFVEAHTYMVRQRIEALLRHGDPAKRDAAMRSIDEVMFQMSRGTEVYEATRLKYRKQWEDAVIDATRGMDGKVNRKAAADWIKHLDEPIPAEISNVVSRQGYRGTMTYGQAIQLYVGLTQRFYADNVMRNKRADHAAKIRSILTPADLKMVTRMRDIYEQRRAELSAVVRKVTGLDVWRPDPLYMPVQMYLGSRGGLGTAGSVRAWKSLSDALTPRVRNNRDFDESVDVQSMFYQRMEDAARAIGYGARGLTIRGVLGKKDLHDVVERYYGKKTVAELMKHVTQAMAGVERHGEGSVESTLAMIRKANTYMALSYNVLSMAKQVGSVPAFMFKLGTGEFVTAISQYDAASWAELKDSDGFKARYMGGIAPEVMEILDDPSQSKLKRAYKAGMVTVQAGDYLAAKIVATGIYKAKVQQLANKGMPMDQAKERAKTETWAIVEETQQSGRTENVSGVYRNYGEMAKLIFQFASAPLMQLSHEYHAAMDAKAGVPGAKERLMRAVLLNHVIIPGIMSTIAWAFNSLLLGDEPPEDRDTILEVVANNLMFEPLSRILIVGSVMEALGNSVLKGKLPGFSNDVPASRLARTVGYAGRSVHDLLTADVEQFQADILELAKQASAPIRHVSTFIENRIAGE